MKIETTFFRDHGTEYIALPFSFVSLNSWKHQILLRSEGERFLPNSPTVPWSSQTHLCCLFLIEPSPKPTFPSSKIRPSWRPYPDHPRPTKTHPKVALSTLLLPPPHLFLPAGERARRIPLDRSSPAMNKGLGTWIVWLQNFYGAFLQNPGTFLRELELICKMKS
jgi:hypothetical protein